MVPIDSFASDSPDRRARDLALVRSYLAGETEASAELGRRLSAMSRMTHRHNSRLGNPLGPEELNEVSQRAVLALLSKIERFDGTSVLEAWASRFCFLELVRFLRDRRVEPRTPVDHVEGSVLEPTVVDSHALLEAGEVLLELEKLEPELAGPLWLKHIDGLTFEEISGRLGVAMSTIKSRYYAGVEQLKRRFAGTLRVMEEEVAP